MKRLKVFIFTSLFVMVLSSTTVFADTDINVTLNGNVVQFTDAEPYVDNNGRTMMPVAKMGELLGVQVGWDNATQTVTLKDGTKVVSLKIGSNILNIDGTPTTMDTKAVITDGRTYVPLSAIAKTFGVDIGWNGASNTVSLKSTSTVVDKPIEAIQDNNENWQIPIDITYTGKYTADQYTRANAHKGNVMVIDEDYLYFRKLDSTSVMRKDLYTGQEEQFTDFKDISKLYITDEYVFLIQYQSSNGHVTGYRIFRVDKESKVILEAPFQLALTDAVEVSNDKISYRIAQEYHECDLNFENDKTVQSSSSIVNQAFTFSGRQISTDITNNNTMKYKVDGNKTTVTVSNETGEVVYNVTINHKFNMHVAMIYDNVVYFAVEDEGFYSYGLETGKADLIADGSFKEISLVENYIFTYGWKGNLIIYNVDTKKLVYQ